jgi:molybdate transport system substrate-binding protein
MTQPKQTTPILILVLFLLQGSVLASEITIAVASNFSNTMKVLVKEFSTQSTTKIKLSIGSTGRHYAQIVNGAPYDLFFAADVERPELLEQRDIAKPNSRFTYAIGRLVLISNQKSNPQLSDLKLPDFKRISIANPKLAPYGAATKQLLINEGLWDSISKKIIKGENVAQALHFFKSGNVQASFIAQSQLKNNIDGNVLIIPQHKYPPINQQAVVIRDSQASIEFIKFIKSDVAKDIMSLDGYASVGDTNE